MPPASSCWLEQVADQKRQQKGRKSIVALSAPDRRSHLKNSGVERSEHLMVHLHRFDQQHDVILSHDRARLDEDTHDRPCKSDDTETAIVSV
jgi:hypothetical protein